MVFTAGIPGVQSELHHPKVFSGAEVTALCRPLDSSTPNLANHAEVSFDHLDPVKRNCNSTACRDIPNNCVFPTLWKQFGKEPYTSVVSTYFWPHNVRFVVFKQHLDQRSSSVAIQE